MTVYGISCFTCRSPNIVPADLPCHKTLISQMTVYGISHCTCRSPPWMAISQIPVKFIFHSYSESSSFGRPVPDISTPIQWWFHRFLWNSYFIPTLRAYHLADQVLADLPPFNSNCAHIWQTKCWQISPPIIWQFHRLLLWQLIFHSYSDSSSFGRPGPDRSTPHAMVILQITVLTAQ